MSMHIASLMKIPCYLLKLSSGNENMGVSRADNSVKIWRNLSISNPKPDLLNVNAYSKFGENPLLLSSYCPETKIWACFGQITPSNINEICPLAIPNQISTISMYIPSLVKIHWCLLVIIRKRKTDGRTNGQNERTHGRPTWNHNTPPLLCGGV